MRTSISKSNKNLHAEAKPQSNRMHSEKNDNSLANAIAELENNRPRYIPSSFKKCRMNRKNKSARCHLTKESENSGTTPPNTGKMRTINAQRQQTSYIMGPLDDLLRIKQHNFF